MFKKSVTVAASAIAAFAVAPAVFAAEGAAPWDYSSLTSSIDFSTISVGVLAVAGLLASVYAGIKGARIVLGFIRS